MGKADSIMFLNYLNIWGISSNIVKLYSDKKLGKSYISINNILNVPL